MGKLVVINGSYRRRGTTTKCLKLVAERISRDQNLDQAVQTESSFGKNAFTYTLIAIVTEQKQLLA